MGEKTGIRWADTTDNPIVVEGGGWYCIKVSDGCQNCYAEGLNQNGFYGGNHLPYAHRRGGPPKLALKREMLAGWANKTTPKKRFVSSMTDWCGEFVPDEWVFEILDAQVAAPRQTFLDLTKRAERMFELVGKWMVRRGLSQAPGNIWLGFSAENQAWFDKRWVYAYSLYRNWGFTVWASLEPLLGRIVIPQAFLSLGKKAWCIVGGESGPHARPMHPDWARGIRNQCQAAGVPFFFKQWGTWLPIEHHSKDPDRCEFEKVGKHAAGYLLDGREWSQFPG